MLRYLASTGLILALTLAGCAHTGKDTTSQPPTDTKADETAPSVADASTDPDDPVDDPNRYVAPMNQFQPQPPDGKWLTDEFGREYYIVEIPRVEGMYLMESPTRVRIQNGFRFDITGHDEDTFFAKVYRPGDPAAPEGPATPTPEELERLAATYRPDTSTSNRFRIEILDSGLPTTGQWRNGFALADMNGDGHLDLVHGPPRRSMNRSPLIFLGDGKGAFSRWTAVSFPQAPFDYGDVAAGDFDGDGHVDLAFAVHLAGLIAVRGDGTGRFTPMQDGLPLVVPGTQSAAPIFSSRTIVAVDWNADGRSDVLALSEGPARSGRDAAGWVGGKQVFTYSDGAWRTIESTELDRAFGDDLATGDFDGDGRLDFANAVSQLGNRNILNLGLADGRWRSAPLEGIRDRSAATAIAAHDLNGDGIDDLVVGLLSMESGEWRTVIDLFLSRSSGGWDRRTLWSEDGRDSITTIGFGNLDGDGVPDLVTLDRAGRAMLFAGDRSGWFTRDATWRPDEKDQGCRGYDVRLADVDGDGLDEIVSAFAGEACPGGGRLRVFDVSSVTPPQP